MRVKIRSTHADPGRSGRDERPHLRQQHDQRHLAHIGGLAGHIGAGDNGHLTALHAQAGVVGDEHLPPEHQLHHRVAASLDLNPAGVIHLGPHIVPVHRQGREAAEDVGHGHHRSRRLHLGRVGRQILLQALVCLVLQRHHLVLGGEDGLLQLLELLGDVALAVGQGLLADVAVGTRDTCPLATSM